MSHLDRIGKLVFVTLLPALALIIMNGRTAKSDPGGAAANWNSPALGFFSNKTAEANITNALSEWDIQLILWPSAEELQNYSGEATEGQKQQCIKWIKKYLKDEWVPAGIETYLLPLRKWSKPDRHWREKGKADVFLCRYQIDDYLIHLVESPGCVTVAAGKMGEPAEIPEDTIESFVFVTAGKLLNQYILPKTKADITLYNQQNKNVTRGAWWCSGLEMIVDSAGRKAYSSDSAAELGATSVTFYTDGSFICFKIRKKLSGPRSWADSYEERFSPGKK